MLKRVLSCAAILLLAISGRILAAAGALGQGQLVSYNGGSYAKAGAVITLIYVVGLALIWLAPETKDRALPD